MLGRSLIADFPVLGRDIRALSPELMRVVVESLGLIPSVLILEKEDLVNLEKFEEIVLSNDEVGRGLAEKYLAGKKISWDTTFLRWNKMNAITQELPKDDLVISHEELHKKFIDDAFVESDKSSDWWRHVGAVLVKDGRVVSSTYNKHAITENTHYIEGEPRSNFDAGKAIAELVIFQHGEASLIAEAARDGLQTLGAEIYVTTFPCPSCAMAIANSGIKKVYYREGYSLLDAERILSNANVELIKVVE